MNPPRKALKVLALSDGRPGHFNKTKALITALESQCDISLTWKEVRLRHSFLRRPLNLLLNHFNWKPKPSQVPLFCRGDTDAITQPDLILSTGGNTLVPNILFARAFNCPNLFVGSLRQLKPKHFWRIITHLDQHPQPPFLHWPITPVNISIPEIEQAGRDFRNKWELGDEPLWLLLLGGDGGGLRYKPNDFEQLAKMIGLAHKQHGIRWLITSSRRTGLANETTLKNQFKPEWIAATSWSSDQGESVYHAFLGAAERIVCTQDSHMMLTEAIASGKPTLSIRPESGDSSGNTLLPSYVEQGYLSQQTIKDASIRGATWNAQRKTLSLRLDKLGAILHTALTETSAQ